MKMDTAGELIPKHPAQLLQALVVCPDVALLDIVFSEKGPSLWILPCSLKGKSGSP